MFKFVSKKQEIHWHFPCGKLIFINFTFASKHLINHNFKRGYFEKRLSKKKKLEVGYFPLV